MGVVENERTLAGQFPTAK